MYCIALPIVMTLARSPEEEQLFHFLHSRSTKPIEAFECLGKGDKCSELFSDENVFVACIERQPISK